MKKNVLTKDFFIEVKKTLGRFLSIFFIVALGVSLFSGIRVAKNDMILSGDAYVDDSDLMDIKIMSTYGLTQADIDAINQLPSIDKAVGSYSIDVITQSNENAQVIKLMSYTDSVNKITVSNGRLPQNENECLIDKSFFEQNDYSLGDTITFTSGTDEELSQTLNTTSYKIVGIGTTPLYFSFDRGSTTIGNGTISGFAIILPQAFNMDAYTEVYATADNAKESLSFTDEYDEIVNEAIEQVKLIQNVRSEIRKNELVQNAQSLVDDAKNQLETEKSNAEEELTANEEKIDEAQLELELSKVTLESGKIQLESAKAQLETAKTTLQQNKELYSQTISMLEEQKLLLEQELANLETQLESMGVLDQNTAFETINNLKQQIDTLNNNIEEVKVNFEQQLKDSEEKIAQSQAQIEQKENEIKIAQNQINSGENQLENSKIELENAQTEIDNQIKHGEDEINKSQSEIENIDLPVWYVFDRSTIPEYTGYRDNADRIAALSTVFPTIFFLVAALISLTTMTRMVEEQRIQIGTLKALGYKKISIMKKYLGYALFATLGGSLLGVLIGEKLYPYVIITAYKIMYENIPNIVVPYQWQSGVFATVIAVLCTISATIFACYKELMAQPANLMRPQAPKSGKRILIEKIPFIWNKFNFSWKSSLRNLFRYKKRFFMTLFGIGGCMGLLLVGFGLRDSIGSIASRQFNELQTYQMSVLFDDEIKTQTKTEVFEYLDNNDDISQYKNIYIDSVDAKKGESFVSSYLVVFDDLENIDKFYKFKNRTSNQQYTLTDDGIIISEKTAQMLNVKKGDTISLSQSSTDTKQVVISNICENYVGHYIYMTEEYYNNLYQNDLTLNTVLIKVDDEDVNLEKIGNEILKFGNILNIQYTNLLIDQLDNMLTSLDAVIIILIVVAGMLSFVVLYNLNNININERRRELATLKVLGFYNGEVSHYVYRENILLTILGILMGCIIGKLLHIFTITTVEVDTAMFSREILLSSFVISAIFTALFSAFVNFVMYFKLKKIDMVEALKSVE